MNPSPIVAVIPAYNEAKHIGSVVCAALKYLPVLVVDDGSTDDTVAIAREAQAFVLCQVPNQGKGAALKAGFRYALDQGYQAILMLDADGQHLPDEIPSFIQKYTNEQADLIIGQRDFSKMPWRRRFSNALGRRLFSWAVRMKIPDNQSGFRLIAASLVRKMLESSEQGFEFEVDMILVALREQFKIAWVPISTVYADETSHIKPWRHFVGFVRFAFKARRSLRK